MTDPTGTTALIGNPDDDFNGIVANLLPDCPPWCIGHLPSDDGTYCQAAFGPWITPATGSPVQMHVVKERGGLPTLNLYADPREEHGAKLTADELRALIGFATTGLNLIEGNSEWDRDPAKKPDPQKPERHAA